MPMAAKVTKKKDKQLNVRFPTDLAERLERTAEALATNPSNMLRRIVVEHLAQYEEQARKALKEGGAK
jgi:predicted DNA-binding protein